MREVVGFDMARDAAQQVYEAAGIGPEDIDVVELHDCFAQNELISYEALGLCPEGGAEKFVVDGDNTYGGKVVTNPSGGLLSKGHPLGATGLAQCSELTQQLRGTRRQAPGRRRAAGAAAQPGPRRRLRRHPLRTRLRDESAMIDKKWIGHELPASVLPIERSRLQFFAKAIGETDPVYTDAAAARDAGYRDLPAPPTFLFAAELDSGAAFRLIEDLQIPIAKLLHGEQSFSYHRPACAGDT